MAFQTTWIAEHKGDNSLTLIVTFCDKLERLNLFVQIFQTQNISHCKLRIPNLRI